MGLVKLIFIILILLFPLGEIFRFTFLNVTAVTINDFLVGLLIIAWLATKLIHKKEFEKRLLTKPISFFVLIGLLSLVVNTRLLAQQEFLISSLYLLRWLFYAGIYFVVSEFDTRFKRLVLCLLVFPGALIILGGFIQYFFYPSLRNLYYLGWDEHLYRMFSSFLDPNFAGIIFVLSFILVGGMFFYAFFEKERKKMFIFGVVELFTLPAIFLTYSRSALIMLFVSACFFLIMSGRKKIIVGVLLIVLLIILILPKTFQTEGTNFLRTASIKARFDSTQKALAIFEKNPVFGVGFNAYRYAQVKEGFSQANDKSHALAGTDNSFLFVLATTGIVGLVSYLFLWREIFKQASIKSKEKFKKLSSIILVSSSVGLFVSALFINSLFYPFIMEWMWILIGVTENK